MKVRNIEMYIGEGSDFGTWGTEYVEIPADTPNDKIEEVAKDAVDKSFDGYCFCGVYAIPDLTDDINCDEDEKFYYEIHVIGKNGFSTSVVSDTELEEEAVILLAYEEDKLHGDDCHYVDYVQELDYDDWNENFNFN